MSLQDLSTELAKRGRPLTRAVLSKYELGQSTPNALVLRDLATILGVKTDYFFTESSVAIEWQAFRKKASISQNRVNQIKSMATQAVEHFLSVENTCGIDAKKSELPEYRQLVDLGEAETVAKDLRALWKLDDLSIKSLAELLESKGIVLVPLASAINDVDGLVGTLSGQRKIIVYCEEKTVDRTRLTIAHELGHLLLGNDDPKLNEKLANRFAGAFLAPAEMLRRDMGNSRISFSIPELCLLKEKYGISIQALTYRAKDLGILTESAYKSMFIYFRSRGIASAEPGDCPFKEKPTLLKHYVFRAVGEGRLSESKAQEIYPKYLEEKSGMESLQQTLVQSFLSLPPEERTRRLYAAADFAASMYQSDGALADFEAMDDVEDYE
jgi:Zn-dependent peptidase ImmA (M78 family)/transcriptional regulator with XRE-family HTH domain